MRALGGWLLLVAGCQDQVTIGYQSEVDTWKQSATDQVDILWVVDNSNSMQLEQSLLAAGFDSFASELDNTNTDFHLGVITTDFDYQDPDRGRLRGSPPFITRDDPNYVEEFKARAQVGLNGSGKEKGLEAAEYALSPVMTTAANSGFLRAEANLLVVIVSDEDDCSDKGALVNEPSEACYSRRDSLVPTGEFVRSFRDLKGTSAQLRLSAIVGLGDQSAICDQSTTTGYRYIEVAGLTGGLSGSICETDWSDMLYELGLNAVGVSTTFFMDHRAVPGTLQVQVNEVPVPESGVDGYTYDPEGPSITFHGSWIPQRGADIVARYDIEPGS